MHRLPWSLLVAWLLLPGSTGCTTVDGEPTWTAAGSGASSGNAGSAALAGMPGNGGQAGAPSPPGGSANAQSGSATGGNATGGIATGGIATGGSGGNAGGASGSANAGSGGASGQPSQGPGCGGTSFALCDDFEAGALDGQLWKLTQNKGTVTLDATRGARGSKSSAHVHVDAGGDTLVGLVESKTFPSLKAALFARAFIFIPSAMSSSLFMGDRHSRLIYAQGKNPYGEYALGIWNGGLIQNHYSESDDSQDTKMLPPFDSWFCLEYELNSAAGNVKAYSNDSEIPELRHDGWPAANIDTLMFGVDRYGSFSVAEDIWFDDVVVDGARIGCDR
jgi:hypothetical protein